MDFEDQTIEQFLTDIASENVSPASGSAVATTGAMAASLCEMTCVHTLNDDPGETRADVESTRNQLTRHRNQLLRLAGQDAEIIETVFSRSRPGPDNAGLKRLLGVPLAIAETCLDVLENGAKIVEWTDRAVVADAKTGIILANASLNAASFIVKSNLDRVSDQTFANQMDRRVREIAEAADKIADGFRGDLSADGRWG